MRDGNGNIMRDDNGYKMYDYGDGMNAGLNRPFLPNSNALQAIRLNSALTNGNAFSGTAFADIKLHRDLTATVNIGTNLDEARSNTVTNPFYGQFAGTAASSSAPAYLRGQCAADAQLQSHVRHAAPLQRDDWP